MLSAAFSDPVHDSQQTFRAMLSALAEPMIPGTLPRLPEAPATLDPACAAILLTLLDQQVRLWAPDLTEEAQRWLQFHTAYTSAESPEQADILWLVLGHERPPLARLKQGELRFPDRSATVVWQVEGFTELGAPCFEGPGFQTPRRLQPLGADAAFWHEWQQCNQHYPLGIDMFFAGNGQLVGLPRSSRLREESQACM